VLVVIGIMGLIAVDVLMARPTVHDAFPGGAHYCSADGPDGRTDGSAGYCADHTAGGRASSGRAAGGRMLLTAVSETAIVVRPFDRCVFVHGGAKCN
jgi:hypothetical protein